MQNTQFSLRFTIYFILIISYGYICAGKKVKKDAADSDDITEETLEIPTEIEPKNISTCSRRSNAHVHEIRKASYNQFPFIAALMSSGNDYLCAGSIVSDGMILTSRECAAATNYALINTTIAKKDERSIVIPILRIEHFPTNTKDVAILYIQKLNNSIASKINISNVTEAKDITHIEAIGFGLNAQVSQPKELQYVGLQVDHVNDRAMAYINCIDTKVPSCFRDKGGPVILNDELVGIVTQGESECIDEMTSKYSVFNKMLSFHQVYVFKAWLLSMIKKYEKAPMLDSYAKITPLRETVHVMTASGANVIKIYVPAVLVQIIILNIL